MRGALTSLDRELRRGVRSPSAWRPLLSAVLQRRRRGAVCLQPLADQTLVLLGLGEVLTKRRSQLLVIRAGRRRLSILRLAESGNFSVGGLTVVVGDLLEGAERLDIEAVTHQTGGGPGARLRGVALTV